MPWQETSVMDERLRFVARLLEGDGMSEVCREFGISRKTGYTMFERYKDHGLEALKDCSRRPVRYANQLPDPVERMTTDNGSCYKAHDFAAACRRLNIRHIRTRPHTPRTNGKAERFIQTTLRQWVYARTYEDSRERSSELPIWLHRYNWHRPHGSLNSRPPVSRFPCPEHNLLRFHS